MRNMNVPQKRHVNTPQKMKHIDHSVWFINDCAPLHCHYPRLKRVPMLLGAFLRYQRGLTHQTMRHYISYATACVFHLSPRPHVVTGVEQFLYQGVTR